MRHTHLIREAAGIVVLALVMFSPAAMSLLAQAPPQQFPDLVGALKSTPGCLGVEAGSMASGKQVIFAWFENKKAVLNWFYSDVHQAAMRTFAPQASTGRVPLAHVADDSGPILAIASLTLAKTGQLEGVQLPVSQIAIELYAPLPGGVAAGGRFAPPAVKVPGLLEAQSGRASTLAIRIAGLSAAKGQLRIAVFNSEQTWLDEASAVYKTALEGDTHEREWRIENVPHGEYAVAVFHDENRDGKLNRNVLGIPQEQYGFSNNARGGFGPANWKDSRFAVANATTEVAIEIK